MDDDGRILTQSEKKERDEMNALIYQKQYERRIPFYYTVATKPAFYLVVFMAYEIYTGVDMPIIAYSILIGGVVFIYRNITNERYYEIEKLYVISNALKIFDFLLMKSKEKGRRHVSAKEIKLEKEKLSAKKLEEEREKREEAKKLEREFEDLE